MNILGGNTFLWRGGVIAGWRPSAPPLPVNQPPVVGPDAAIVPAGGTILIDVLANDTDPEGGALTLSGPHAATGQAAIETDGRLRYTAPADFAGSDTVTYTVADAQGAATPGELTVEVFAFAVTGGDVAGEFVVSAAPGQLTVTILDPAEYAGDYLIDTADLEAGPINLIPPQLGGTALVGETVTAAPGLWAFDEADGPLVAERQWLRGGTPIAGATGSTYVLAAEDADQPITHAETATTTAGSRSVSSAAIRVQGTLWTPAALPGLELWLDAADPATITLSGTEITAWQDKSGKGRHAMRGFATGPAVGAALNGLGTVDIGIDRALAFPSPGIVDAADRSVLMAVGPFAGGPGERAFVALGGGGNEGAGRRWAVVSDGQRIRVEANAAYVLPELDAVQPGLVGAFHSGPTFAGLSMMRDGVYTTGLSTSTTALVTLDAPGFIGRRASNDTGESAGPIGEVLLCSVLLSRSDREKAEGYLAHKWGFADRLPAAHPYKTAAPRA